MAPETTFSGLSRFQSWPWYIAGGRADFLAWRTRWHMVFAWHRVHNLRQDLLRVLLLDLDHALAFFLIVLG